LSDVRADNRIASVFLFHNLDKLAIMKIKPHSSSSFFHQRWNTEKFACIYSPTCKPQERWRNLWTAAWRGSLRESETVGSGTRNLLIVIRKFNAETITLSYTSLSLAVHPVPRRRAWKCNRRLLYHAIWRYN